MRLKPFLLDAWLDQYEHGIDFNLAASTGPNWTVKEILALADEETRERFLNHKLVYSRPAGARVALLQSPILPATTNFNSSEETFKMYPVDKPHTRHPRSIFWFQRSTHSTFHDRAA